MSQKSSLNQSKPAGRPRAKRKSPEVEVAAMIAIAAAAKMASVGDVGETIAHHARQLPLKRLSPPLKTLGKQRQL